MHLRRFCQDPWGTAGLPETFLQAGTQTAVCLSHWAAVCLLSQRDTTVGANKGLQLRRTRELPPQPHILITRSFYFHGNGRIRDFDGTTITSIGNLTVQPATLPSPVPAEEMALTHTTALHPAPAPRPATLRRLLRRPAAASWVSREPPMSAHQGTDAHDPRGSVQCRLVRQLIPEHTQ